MKQLKDFIQNQGHPLCVGIDPHENLFSPFMVEERRVKGVQKFLEQWVRVVVEAVGSKVKIYKMQSSFFESYGVDGIKALKSSMELCRSKNMYTILDAKRGDIASTMVAYGRSAFDYFESDALTIVPYMGVDVISPLRPWLSEGKSVFVIAATSNSSAGAIQECALDSGALVSHKVIGEFSAWAQEHSLDEQVGYVVGANKLTDELLSFGHFLLLPGVGSQGADPQNTNLKANLQHNQGLVPVSRGITGGEAKSWDDFAVQVQHNAARYCRILG